MCERLDLRPAAKVWTLCLSLATSAVAGCGDSVEQSAPQMTAASHGAGTGIPAATGRAGAPSAGAPAAAGSMSALPAANVGGTAGSAAARPQAATSGVGAGGTGSAPIAVVGAAGAPAAGSGAAAAGSVAPAAGASAAAGSGGSAGAGTLPSGATDFVSVCAGGKVGMDSDAAKATLRGLDIRREYSGVKMLIRSPNAVLSFKTTLQVPRPPTQKQTLFIWPGLQSRDGAADPGRVGNGVLQPVLTWGSSCAPKAPRDPYAGWWIAGMYVKTGCQGGDYLTTNLGDLLEIDMFLKDEKWVTTIKNVMMGKTVDFTVDLKGQVQNEVMWLTEVPDGSSIRPVDDVIWTQSVLTFKEPEKTCQPNRIGSNDYFSAPVLSPDGLHCCWDKIIMRAQR